MGSAYVHLWTKKVWCVTPFTSRWPCSSDSDSFLGFENQPLENTSRQLHHSIRFLVVTANKFKNPFPFIPYIALYIFLFYSIRTSHTHTVAIPIVSAWWVVMRWSKIGLETLSIHVKASSQWIWWHECEGISKWHRRCWWGEHLCV